MPRKRPGPAPRAQSPTRSTRPRSGLAQGETLFAALALAALTLFVYAPVRHHDFVNFDDTQYVVENPHVVTGLTAANVRWAFATGYAGNWHPLTWISHMADVELFGVDAGAHHVMNVAYHLIATLLFFAVLLRMTSSLYPSAFVAAIFAVHPLHVESVAWIAERKDVLSGCFWMLTLLAYLAYLKRPGPARYAALILVFALGLMTKPMLVTLPFVLLLVDAWIKRPVRIVEKLPLFLLAALSSVVTLIVQQQAGAVKTLDALPFSARLANAAVAYVAYIGKAIWPANLAAIYPYPASRSMAVVAGAVLVLAAVSIAVARVWRTRPYLAVGWFWFLGTLVPVIGLVQVGSQPIADRYMYLPLIGLAIVAAWGVPDLMSRFHLDRRMAIVAGAAIVVGYAATARAQVAHWQNGVALWEHAVAVTRDNYRAHGNLGQAFQKLGRLDEAIAEEQEAIRINPAFAEARNNLGKALIDRGRATEALPHLEEAVRLLPDYIAAHNNLGLALAAVRRPAEAVREFREALRLNPGFAPAQTNLGTALASQGQLDDAIAAFREALRLQPDAPQVRQNLARALAERGQQHLSQNRVDDAIRDLNAALEFQPPFAAEVHYELGVAYAKLGRTADAIAQLQKALQIDPSHVEARQALAVLKGR
jgi:protein O-mannosyl-transferase